MYVRKEMMYGIITETAYTPCACKDQCEVPEACIELKNSVVKPRWLGKAQSLSDGLVYPAESVSYVYVGVSAEPHPIPILAPSYLRLRLYLFLPQHNPIFLFPKSLTYFYHSIQPLSHQQNTSSVFSINRQTSPSNSVANRLDSQRCL